MNKKYKFDMLTEDLTLGSNNYMGSSGGNSGATKPKRMSILDMIKAQEKMVDQQNHQPGVLPYPLSTGVLEKFSEAYFAIESIKQLLKQTSNNPLISDVKENKEAVIKMHDKCKKLQHLIELCGNDLDTLTPS